MQPVLVELAIFGDDGEVSYGFVSEEPAGVKFGAQTKRTLRFTNDGDKVQEMPQLTAEVVGSSKFRADLVTTSFALQPGATQDVVVNLQSSSKVFSKDTAKLRIAGTFQEAA